MDAAGNLYGTTARGGGFDSGTVFKVNTSGTESVLHSFKGPPDGGAPATSLVFDTKGNLYGTTVQGGSCNRGTVFKLDPSGTESVLYSFVGSPDGQFPEAGLVIDVAGNLYGTTDVGGGPSFAGTVFKVNPSETESVLYSFGNAPDGGEPEAPLVFDGVGNLYGTTEFGGSSVSGGTTGGGTVFKLDPSGTETVVHSFTGSPDGAHPVAGLVRDTAGNFYGTTTEGGSSNLGTVFKLDQSGILTVLYSFMGSPDGAIPTADLIMDSAGNLYGTTQSGGPSNDGTVFKLDPSGTESVLHRFMRSATDGAHPEGGLIMDEAGNFYGTTGDGGSSDFGTVFKLTLPVTYASLINLVKQFVTKSGVATSMVAKLQAAEADADRGNEKAVDGTLGAFIHEVSAQSGKSLTSAQAATLIQQAKTLIT